MKYKIIIESPAIEDMERALSWIVSRSRASAIRWYRDLVEAIKTLETFPKRCSLAPENEAFQEEIRQLLYGKRRGVYRVLFTIQGRNVHILHVRHCAQGRLKP